MSELLIEGRKPIFHVVMMPEMFGITQDQADGQDMAEEYAIVSVPDANAGIMIYGKFNGEWKVNPWSTRFLVRHLLAQINILP